MNCWKLAPSDLTFLFEACRRCFYLKVRGLLHRPRTPMPKIFTTIDAAMKKYLQGRRTDALAIGMPSGTFEYAERWVESSPIGVPGCASTFFVRGRVNNLLQPDRFGLGLVDLKTCHRRDEHVPLYGHQLHAYAWALENPSGGTFFTGPIERMGLLVFEPDLFVALPTSLAALAGHLEWIKIPRDDRAFLKFVGEVVTLLDRSSAPDPSPGCPWCRYKGSPILEAGGVLRPAAAADF
jgi:hypothetical protein